MKAKLYELLSHDLNQYSNTELEEIADLLESYHDQIFALLVSRKVMAQ